MSQTIHIWSGGAESYDAYRPQSPPVLMNVLTQLAQIQRPHLVVDLGSGTGLSTLMWAEQAERVIGVEPNAEMRRQAEIQASKQPHVRNVTYQDGVSAQTNLPSDSADIVTCSQSLHWMEPEPTFEEIARILRPGGVFAAYDYDLPFTIHWEVEQSENEVMTRFRALRQGVTEQELGIDQLKEVAHKVIGDEPIPWYLSYRVRIGIK